MSLLTPMLLGLLAGLGTAALAFGLLSRRESLQAALTSLAEPNWPIEIEPAADPLTRFATAMTGPIADGLQADLALLGRTSESHALDKLRTAVFWASLPVTLMLAGQFGLRLFSPMLSMIASVVLFVGGWFLADSQVRQRAAIRRRDFRSTLVSYLQLVTILLAGGAGVNQALAEAAAYGQGWSFEVIQRSLRSSETRGVSPWEGFATSADELGLDHLRELAAAMQLAGQSGAHVRQSLLAKSESLRVHELTEIEADAASASEKMGGPVGAMVVGFVITMGYPAFVSILSL